MKYIIALAALLFLSACEGINDKGNFKTITECANEKIASVAICAKAHNQAVALHDYYLEGYATQKECEAIYKKCTSFLQFGANEPVIAFTRIRVGYQISRADGRWKGRPLYQMAGGMITLDGTLESKIGQSANNANYQDATSQKKEKEFGGVITKNMSKKQ